MKLSDELLTSFSHVPSNQYFGFQLVSRTEKEAVLSMEVRQEHLQETGVVHGGILSSLADSAAVYTFFPDLKDGQTMISIEFKINFLRPGLKDHGPLMARATVIKRGRKIGLCDVEVTQSGDLVAKGSFTYLFYDSDS